MNGSAWGAPLGRDTLMMHERGNALARSVSSPSLGFVPWELWESRRDLKRQWEGQFQMSALSAPTICVRC